jgi:hypothetical protein
MARQSRRCMDRLRNATQVRLGGNSMQWLGETVKHNQRQGRRHLAQLGPARPRATRQGWSGGARRSGARGAARNGAAGMTRLDRVWQSEDWRGGVWCDAAWAARPGGAGRALCVRYHSAGRNRLWQDRAGMAWNGLRDEMRPGRAAQVWHDVTWRDEMRPVTVTIDGAWQATLGRARRDKSRSGDL